jgi:hypothetical protein
MRFAETNGLMDLSDFALPDVPNEVGCLLFFLPAFGALLFLQLS